MLNKMGNKIFLIGCVWGKGGRERGVSCLKSLSRLFKMALALWISNRMSPSSSFYDKDFNKNLYNPSSRIECGGSVLIKGIISWTLNCMEKMAISKFRLDVFGEMVGVEGVLVAFQSLSTIKKSTSHSNFQSNELFSKFLRQLLR